MRRITGKGRFQLGGYGDPMGQADCAGKDFLIDAHDLWASMAFPATR